MTVLVPDTNGQGTTYNLLNPQFNETITLTLAGGVNPYPATAGQTGINILPPTFSALDQIIVSRSQDETASDANIGEFVVKRTDSGAVVHEMYSKVGFVAFSLESGDTALTIDNLDSTNAQTYFVTHLRKN